MFNLIFLNLSVFATSFLLTRHYFYFSSLLDSVISFFILFCAQIILTLQILGIIGALSLNNVLILNTTVLLAVFFSIKIFRIKQKNLFNTSKVFIETIKLSRIETFCLFFILGFGLVKIFVNLINPPFGWDCLNYHFTFPVEWMKTGRLDNPMVVSDDPFPAYYPINGSLFFLWLILPFRSAYLADLGQLPFFIISFFALLSIANKLTLPRRYSFLAACLFVFIPNYFKQLQIAYVDIMIASTFLVSLNFLLGLKKDLNLKNFIIFTLSLGIFIGIKTPALVYSIFILLPFFFILFGNSKINFLKKIEYLIFFTLLIMTFGCFSYLRNFFLTLNPFYPLNIKIFGKTIFKGAIDYATFIYRNEEGGRSLIKLLFHEGLGVQSLLIVLPATILAFPLNLIKNKNKQIFMNYFLLLPILLYLAYSFLMPIPNSRYLYPMLGTGMIVGFYLFYLLNLPFKLISVIAIISILASAAESARHLELLFSLLLTFLLLIGAIFWSKYFKRRIYIFSRSSIIVFFIISMVLLKLCFIDYKNKEYQRYIYNSRYWPDATRAWLWLNQNTKGDNIAYIGRPIPFPLYGTNLKNNVYYVSVNSHDPIHLHDLKDSAYYWNSPENMHENFYQSNNYRGKTDYSVWLNNLDNRKTDFLFIYSLHHTKEIMFPIEEKWAKGHPEKFDLVFSNNSVRIYKLKR